MTVMNKLEYPLVALILSEAECDYVMAPVLEGALSTSGLCRKFPREMLYVDR